MFLGNYFSSSGMGDVPALILHCLNPSPVWKGSLFERCIRFGLGKMGVGGAGTEAIKAKFMVRENPALPSQLSMKHQRFIIASFPQVSLKAKIWENWGVGEGKSPFSEQPGDLSRSQEIPGDPRTPEVKVLV